MTAVLSCPRDAKRLVVKIGSALLVDMATRTLREGWLAALAADIAALRKSGTECIIVSSGAGALGREYLHLPAGPLPLAQKQAAAACGQPLLIAAYDRAFAPHELKAAQILLTTGDTEARRRHLNARGTIHELLGLGAVPVINENDTVATDEIRFGDNDRLAARIAQMVSADLLVLLSDIDGLYSADPRQDATARLLAEVPLLTPEIEAMAGEPPPGYSSGGMVTKLAAAKIATAAGCAMIIARGTEPHALARLNDETAQRTLFHPVETRARARKQWIAGHVNPRGRIIVDAGAARALDNGKSLLPAGVQAIEGDFGRGDLVLVCTQDGEELARGLSAYDHNEAARIAGLRSSEIEAVLGYRRGDALIHRDDLVQAGPQV